MDIISAEIPSEWTGGSDEEVDMIPMSTEEYNKRNTTYMDIDEITNWELSYRQNGKSKSNKVNSTPNVSVSAKVSLASDALPMLESIPTTATIEEEEVKREVIDKHPDAWNPASESVKDMKLKYDETDVLYDPHADADDEKWVAMKRTGGSSSATGTRSSSGRAYNTTSKRKGDKKKIDKNEMKTKKKKSDAVLSCPCCFSVVCTDCQRYGVEIMM